MPACRRKRQVMSDRRERMRGHGAVTGAWKILGGGCRGAMPPCLSIESMRLQYASFLLPLHADSGEQDELNRFLRGRRVVQTRKELVATEGASCWAILVEYLDSPEKNSGEQQKGKVDYKEILNAADFSLFSKLRETRKKLAEENGLPVYAVCTN